MAAASGPVLAHLRQVTLAETSTEKTPQALDFPYADGFSGCHKVGGFHIYIVGLWITGRSRARPDWTMAKRRVHPRPARAKRCALWR
jgi:hypothetical protein